MTDNKNHGQLPLFTIIFQDGSIFVGGNSYLETKWTNIPIKKPIKRIFYRLPSNDYLCLEGYDKYFRMSEALKDLNGKQSGVVRLQYDYIMAKKGNIIRSYRITLDSTAKLNVRVRQLDNNSRYKTNDITTRIFDINDKFIKGLNPDIWRG